MYRDLGIMFGTTPMMPVAIAMNMVSILLYVICSSFAFIAMIQIAILVNKIDAKLTSHTVGWRICNIPSQCGNGTSVANVKAYSTY